MRSHFIRRTKFSSKVAASIPTDLRCNISDYIVPVCEYKTENGLGTDCRKNRHKLILHVVRVLFHADSIRAAWDAREYKIYWQNVVNGFGTDSSKGCFSKLQHVDNDSLDRYSL